MGIATDIIVIVVAALVSGLIAQRLRQPLIVGYILVGVVVGPQSGILPVGNIEEIGFLAELGVALLLFAVGLEFSLDDLRAVRQVAVVGAGVQMVVTIAGGMAIARWLGFDWTAAVWFGAIVAPSGTLVILKTLGSRGLIGTLSSRVIVGILIVQDLLSIPLMLLLPELGDLEAGVINMGFALLRAALFLIGMFFIGTRLIPYLMKVVARWNSRELFMLAVTALGLGVGLLTHFFGLSFAFGAFVAGMVLSESDYSYQALSDIIPLRDLFGMLFFVSVGMLLDPQFLVANIVTIAQVVGLVLVLKLVLFSTLTRLMGYGNIVPIAVGLSLFSLGEFSFVLARVGLSTEAITPDLYSLLLSVAIVTTILTPILSWLAVPIYALRQRYFTREPLRTINLPQSGLRDHIVIAGGGELGYHVAQILQRMNQPFVVIEINQRRVEIFKQAQMPIIYGDASHEVVLETASTAQACLFLALSPAVPETQMMVENVRKIKPDLHIVARVEGLEQMAALNDYGIYEVVQPNFEAGLEIVRQSLIHLNVPAAEVQRYTDAVRAERYAPLRGNGASASPTESSNS